MCSFIKAIMTDSNITIMSALINKNILYYMAQITKYKNQHNILKMCDGVLYRTNAIRIN